MALAVVLYSKGEQEKAYQLAEKALRIDKSYADITLLRENLWSEKLINDAKKLLSKPRIKAFLSELI